MTVRVRGINVEATQALKEYVEKRVAVLEKQFKQVSDITAVLKVQKGFHTVELTLVASSIVLRAQETTKDMYSSIDLVVDKIERQIHKYKTRLMKRKYNNFREITPTHEGDVAEEDFKVVRNKRYNLRPMNVEEAILQMNLVNHDFFIFFNDDEKATSVVYRRKDEDYGLITLE